MLRVVKEEVSFPSVKQQMKPCLLCFNLGINKPTHPAHDTHPARPAEVCCTLVSAGMNTVHWIFGGNLPWFQTERMDQVLIWFWENQ